MKFIPGMMLNKQNVGVFDFQYRFFFYRDRESKLEVVSVGEFDGINCSIWRNQNGIRRTTITQEKLTPMKKRKKTVNTRQ